MNTVSPAYLEIIDFIATGATSEEVAAFEPSADAKCRVAELVGREKDGQLTAEEKAELDHFIELEHILRVAKTRARQILSGGERL